MQREEVLHFGSPTRRVDMVFESAARLAKQLAQLGGTRGDWFRVVMEKFVVNFRLECWLQHADPQKIGSKLVTVKLVVPSKCLEFPLGKSKKDALFGEVIKQLVTPNDTVTNVYLLNGQVDYIYFLACLQTPRHKSKSKKKRKSETKGEEQEHTELNEVNVFKLLVSQSTNCPRGISKTDITPNNLKVHDPTNASGFIWSRAFVFDNQVFGERWEYGPVYINQSLFGLAAAQNQRKKRTSR
jgi:hypothetical protein